MITAQSIHFDVYLIFQIMSDPTKQYFRSYESLNVHELMIKDTARTEAYRDFLEKNEHLIRDKVVLDVGSGTGILSLFAARCGAKRVYAVEASAIAELCQEIVNRNKFEGVIQVINDKVESVKLPENVDVIISEWMGFYLLHESMLESVIHARDKWLKPDGIILPSHASIYVCPVDMAGFCRDNFEFWEDVYGFDFTPFQERMVAAHLSQPAVVSLKPQQLLSDAKEIISFDVKTVKLAEIQELEEKFSFQIYKHSVLHGFAAWFDVVFNPCIGKRTQTEESVETRTSNEKTTGNSVDHVTDQVTLSTSPESTETHWKQTVCFLPLTVRVEEDEMICCKVSLCQDTENKRLYNISLQMLDNVDDTDDDESDDDFEEDTSRHPVPCDCGSGRCRIISALVEKYDAEQNELEMEAEFVDVSAEVQAAQTLDKDYEPETLHMSNSTSSVQEDQCAS